MSGEKSSGIGRNLARLLVYGFLFVFFCVNSIGTAPIEFGFTVAFGWVMFLVRTVPQMQFNADLAAMALLCALVIGFGLNWLGRWLLASVAASRGAASGSIVWQRKWAWSAVLGLALVFLVGMSVGGVAHQVGWMAASDEPMWADLRYKNLRVMVDMRRVSEAVWTEMQEENGDLQTVRQGFREGTGAFATYFGLPIANFQGFAIMDGNTWAGSIVFPRNQELSQRYGGFYQNKDLNEKVDADKLESLIRENRSKLISF